MKHTVFPFVLALFSCAPMPQAQVLPLPGGATITITQGCPVAISRDALEGENALTFAINDTAIPSPFILRGALSPTSYIIIMKAGSYPPGTPYSCTEKSLHSFIRIDGAAQSSISIRPVRNWQKEAGPEALAGYERNVQDCERNGPRWPKGFLQDYSVRVPELGKDAQIYAEGLSGDCPYIVDKMSQAMILKVGRSSFVMSKIVDDLFVRELK